MKTMPLLTALLLVAVTFVCPLWAQDTSVGCGLGSMAIKEHRTLVSATARFSLNWLSFNQLFGVSSGTSGCGKYRLVQYLPQWQERYFYAHQEDIIETLIKDELEAPVLSAFPLEPACKSLTQLTETQNLGVALLQASDKKMAWQIFALKINESCHRPQMALHDRPSLSSLFGSGPAKY